MMARFRAAPPDGQALLQLEGLVRTALFQSARQVQRLVQQVGAAAQKWQERAARVPEPQSQAAPVMYVSADATGGPMRQEELEGRAGQQPDGGAELTRLSPRNHQS